MRTTTLAVALALALTGLGGVISASPQVQAQNFDCPNIATFVIPDSEPPDASARILLAGATEVGLASVSSGSDEVLHVKLVDAGEEGELQWTVFEENSGGECEKVDDPDCEQTMSTDEQGTTLTCDLPAPSSGVKNYGVEFAEISGDNLIRYKPWTEGAI